MSGASIESCANCGAEAKCRRRDFSEQAWGVLLLWKEVQTATVDQPVCDDCYNELREVLIDRADEIEEALGDSALPSQQSTPQRNNAGNKERKAS